MIKNFTNNFLNYSRITLFILFVMASFNWHSTFNSTSDFVTTIINLIGGISFLSWIYAIGQRANERLLKLDITLKIFKYFNYGFIVIIVSVLLMFFLSQGQVSHEDNSGILTYHITYTKPGEIAFILIVGLIFTVLVAAKTLVSAEKSKNAEFGEYLPTLLLFAFSLIGLWWIQPRVSRL